MNRALRSVLWTPICLLNVHRVLAMVNHLLCTVSEEGGDPILQCITNTEGGEEAPEHQVVDYGVECGARASSARSVT